MILDKINGFVHNAKIYKRISVLGDKTRGHLYLRPNIAPTATDRAAGAIDARSTDYHLHYYGGAATALDTRLPCALTGSKTHDFASVADGANATTTVTVTGAALGDYAFATLGVALTAGVIVHAFVSAADTVTVVVSNESGSAYDAASTTLRATVLKA